MCENSRETETLLKRPITTLALGSFIVGALLASPAQTVPPLHGLNVGDMIVFQGDSITDGGRARTGNDYNHTMGQDYAYIVSAEFGAVYPDRNLTFINRGISGDTVPRLVARWKSDTLDLKPNLLSILVGVNDTFFSDAGESAEVYESSYDKLLSDTLAALPGVKIILGEPFLLPVGNYKDGFAKHLAELKKRQDAVARLAAKYHLPLIHYQKMMTDACAKAPAEHWSWDGVHPTYAGHGLMAAAWLRAVDEAFPGK